jgi:hypothetical protein
MLIPTLLCAFASVVAVWSISSALGKQSKVVKSCTRTEAHRRRQLAAGSLMYYCGGNLIRRLATAPVLPQRLLVVVDRLLKRAGRPLPWQAG